MEALADRIRADAVYLGDGIIKVDGILNHMVDPALMSRAGEIFARAFSEGEQTVTKVVTAETSGIIPAFTTANALGVPVVFARKRRPITMGDPVLRSRAPSRTGGDDVELMVAQEYLGAGDRVLVIDDFLGTGKTLCALVDVVHQSGATLVGIGCVIEKVFESHDPRLSDLAVPLVTLVQVDLDGDVVLAYSNRS